MVEDDVSRVCVVECERASTWWRVVLTHGEARSVPLYVGHDEMDAKAYAEELAASLKAGRTKVRLRSQLVIDHE